MKEIKHDNIVHHPLGGGSYVFGNNLLDYLFKNIKKDELKISIGAQPNSSPHFGTLVVFSFAFAIAKKIKSKGKKVSVFFEVVDTAPSEKIKIKNIVYQKSLRKSEEFAKNFEQYKYILEKLKEWSGISYEIRYQHEFNSLKTTQCVVSDIIKNKDVLSSILDPKKQRLRIRIACPICNLSDKEGENNIIDGTRIISKCPNHGIFEENAEDSIKNFEFNTPLRNLIRALVYSKENNDKNIKYEWLRLTGSDYAGFYQEQLLYKTSSILNVSSHSLPIILYAPLITDWSGAKLSKSLYLNQNAYNYLPNYVVNFNELNNIYGEIGLKTIFLETINWVENPYMIFRCYSVYYFMNLIESKLCPK